MHGPNEDGVTAGWKLVIEWARESLPREARRRIFGLAIVVGAAVSTLSAVVFTAVDLTPVASADTMAVCAGVSGASLAAYVAVLRGTRSPVKKTTTRPKRREFMSVGLKDGSETGIRVAWLEGREPDVDVAERLIAATGARRVRGILPRAVLLSFTLVPLWLAGTTVAVLLAVDSAEFLSLFYVPAWGAFSIAGAVYSLHALGRTRAPLETEPEVPEHLEPGGRRKTKPYKLLGTDHPDDYAR